MKARRRSVPFEVTRLARRVLAVALTTVSVGVLSGICGPATAADRVVVVGDVHGDIEDFRKILEAAGLVDTDGRWSGGTATLVQTGDLVERGTKVRDVLDLMMRLEEEAEAAGGRVVALLGNHEAYNLLGFLDYTSTPPEVYAEIFAGFADEDSAAERQQALRQWTKWQRGFPECGAQSKEEWEAGHPEGFIEYFEALGPDGRYGPWFRSHAVMVRVGSTMFSHAGPSPALAEKGFESIYAVNRAIEQEVEAFDEARRYLVDRGVILPFFTLAEIYCAVNRRLVELAQTPPDERVEQERTRLLEVRQMLPDPKLALAFDSDGPLWYRGLAQLADDEARPVVEALLDSWRVDSIVVGHTPQRGRIQERFGAVFLVDTAMAYGPEVGGSAAALEIVDGRFTAVYEDERELLVEPTAERELVADVDADSSSVEPWIGPDGAPLPFRSGEEVVDYLGAARVLEMEDIPVGITDPRKLLLERFGIRAHAVFRDLDEESRNKQLSRGRRISHFRDSYRNEVAAYELSLMLGMDNLPPATLRTIDRQKGSVQLWVENAMTEKDRLDKKIHPPNQLLWQYQLDDMRVFDNLIFNFDRNQGNILIDSDWKIWLIDHTRSFGANTGLSYADRLMRCSRRLWEALEALDEEAVSERLGPYLKKSEIKALFTRRQKVIDHLKKRIAELGEDRVLISLADQDAEAGAEVLEALPLEPAVLAPEADP